MGNLPVHLATSFRTGRTLPPDPPPRIKARLVRRLIVVACLAVLGLCWPYARRLLGL